MTASPFFVEHVVVESTVQPPLSGRHGSGPLLPLRWYLLPGPGPRHWRLIAIDDAGDVYVTEEATNGWLCATADGFCVVWAEGSVYVPLTWVCTERPELAEGLRRLEQRVRAAALAESNRVSACLLCGRRPGRPRSLPGAAGPVSSCPVCALAVRRSAERTDPDPERALDYPLATVHPNRDNAGMARPRKRPGRRPALAERLRAARAARGLSQVQAAAELGIALSKLSEYETGSRRPSTLARLALEWWAALSLGEPVSLNDLKEPS